ncbi:MAG: histidine--tRNA ligase, partial [Terriglobia bacterium]
KRRFQAVKGTRDILPPESALWQHVEQTARQVLAAYNYREIRLPLFEETEVFARSVGAETDIIAKEMYIFEDRDGTALALRPEATASLVRAYIQNSLYQQPGLVKLYYIGPMFRRERPQKGRYRQFYQIGAEVLGRSDHPAIDAEVVEMLLVLIARVGLRGTTLYVNSIGCASPAGGGAGCRPKYVERLKRELLKVKSKLGPDSQRRLATNPLRVLDSKLADEQPIIQKLPSILDHPCAACREHFEEFQQELKDRDIAYEINWRLVRGLDYYMRTTFEITAQGLGAQNAICGGGRYDGLVELLGGPPAKGIGWALGTDRFLLALSQAGAICPASGFDVFIAWLGESARQEALRLTRTLREKDFCVEMAYEEAKLRKSLQLADKLGARFTVILGEDELKQGKLTLREMATGQQQLLSQAELLARLAH